MMTRLSLLAGTSLIALTQTALAQDDPVDLGTIILQGELQSRTVTDSQTSVAVETGDDLLRRGDRGVYDMVARTPNVSAIYGEKGFAIRGVDANGFGGTNGLLISTVVDGAALPSSATTFFGPFSSWDMDQVEVLRGPQSTQQGRNALAGSIVLNSKTPELGYREFKVHGGMSDRNGYRVALMGNVPLVDDRLALRVKAERRGEDGYVTSRTLNDDTYDARSYESYGASLKWAPNEAFEAVLSYNFTDSDGGEDYVLASEFPKRRVTDQNAPADEGVTHKAWALNLRYDINPSLTLVSETNSYRGNHTRIEGDVAPRPHSIVSIDADYETFEQDIRAQYEGDGLRGVLGLFYTKIEGGTPFTFSVDVSNLNPTLPSVIETRTSGTTTEARNTALYGEAEFDADGWLTGLGFVIGARYDRETFKINQRVDYALDVLAPLGLADVAPRSASYDFEAFLPKVGVTYDFGGDQTIGLTVQRGYRAGGVEANVINNQLYPYAPEYTTNYELSYRGSFRNDRLRVSGNAYYTRWTDQQVRVQGGNTANPFLAGFDSFTTNAGESKQYGIELSVEGEPSDRLRLFGSLGIARSAFVDFRDPVQGTNYAGNRLPNAPEQTAAIGGTYSWDNGLDLSFDAAYTGAAYSNAANTLESDSRWVVNMQAVKEWDNGLTGGLYVRNLLDEDYVTSRGGDGSIVRTGEPRTLGAYLEMTF